MGIEDVGKRVGLALEYSWKKGEIPTFEPHLLAPSASKIREFCEGWKSPLRSWRPTPVPKGHLRFQGWGFCLLQGWKTLQIPNISRVFPGDDNLPYHWYKAKQAEALPASPEDPGKSRDGLNPKIQIQMIFQTPTKAFAS